MKARFTRRKAIKIIAGSTALAGAGVAGTSEVLARRIDAAEQQMKASHSNGRINHSACRWCYADIPMDDLCKAARQIGLQSIELLNPEDFDTVKKYDLTCAMVSSIRDGFGIDKGWNRPEHHAPLTEIYEYLIAETAKAGFQNLICFSGNRAGQSDEEGIRQCATGLQKIMLIAEKYRVNIVMELLNSKVDHKDYQCDRTSWGAALADAVGSDRFGLLYDIYHMQIMEGDVIRTINTYQKYLFHYHTGGVPGRNEIDGTQELHYPAIMRAIADTGFKGFVGQEFIPKNSNKLASLQQGIQICSV